MSLVCEVCLFWSSVCFFFWLLTHRGVCLFLASSTRGVCFFRLLTHRRFFCLFLASSTRRVPPSSHTSCWCLWRPQWWYMPCDTPPPSPRLLMLLTSPRIPKPWIHLPPPPHHQAVRVSQLTDPDRNKHWRNLCDVITQSLWRHNAITVWRHKQHL